MMQVMQNLVANAIKFHGPERPIIQVTATPGTKDWTFSVKDNGIGLNVEYAEKIFQMFQRLHSKETYPGTGVGLAIAKKIVERHGGHIWVESEENKGATFFFTIPTDQGHEMSLDKVQSPRPAMPREHAGCPKTIANGDDVMAMANFRLDDRQEPSPRFRKSNDLNWWHYRRQGPFHSYQQLNLMLPMQVK